ncbi:MAG: aminobenzoyl-glutamate utilization protein B [Natronomonas sp.]|jgi:aminobenzoyl-glutamate utilization protein B
MDQLKQTAVDWVNSEAETITGLAEEQWERPQLPMCEEYAATALSEWLEDEGFEVELGVSNMETAFVAEYAVGDGGPTVGFIAEYDALADLSNVSEPVKEPLEEDAPGHGCGHNLIGTGNIAAAIAVKEALVESGTDGTVRVYGSPGEELLISNVFMTRDGLFEGDDMVLTSHPKGRNPTASTQSSLALISTEFVFHGQSCHTPSSPEEGRHALDAAVQLINGANALDKHMDQDTIIEYVITEGGYQPNVVPSISKVWFFIRNPDVEKARESYEKIRSAAEGAATATDTELEEAFITGCHPYLMNDTITETIYENAVDLGGPSYSEEERELAQELLDEYEIEADEPIKEEVKLEKGGLTLASQDDGDTSWVVPMGRLQYPYPTDVPLHTWGATVASGSSLGQTGMLFNAKTLACTAIDAIADPELLAAIEDEFETATVDYEYECLAPEDVEPIDGDWVQERLGE